MKLVLAGISLLVATVAVGVGCGPKEKYCYQDMETCAEKERAVEADAMWKPDADAEAASGVCYNASGMEIPCTGG